MHHIISNSSDLQRSRRRTRKVARCSCAIALLGFVQLVVTSAAAEEYADRIRPLLATYCLECHSTKAQEAGFDIQRFATLGEVRADLEAWQEMLDMLQRKEMPPEGEPQPEPRDRQRLVTWIQSFLEHEADLRAGDPGPVLVRRLNNAEYRYTVRDLTGVDLQPTSHFPADGAAGEGFLNATDTLAISPGLMTKYLDAAKEITSHAVLLPDSFRFSNSTFREDWVNESLGEIQAIYIRYTTDQGEIPLEQYLAATMVHRDALSSGQASLEQVATAEKLSLTYLRILWQLLTDDQPSILLDGIRAQWNRCTTPVANAQATATQPDAGPAEAGHDKFSNLLEEIFSWQGLLWRRQRPDGAHALDHRFAAAPVSVVENHIYQLEMPAEKTEQPAAGKPDTPVIFYLAAQTVLGQAGRTGIIVEHPRFEVRDESGNASSDQVALTLRDALIMAAEVTTEETPALPEGVKPIDLSRFGSQLEVGSQDENSLRLHGSELLAVRLPASLVAGKTFVVDVRPAPDNGPATLVRLDVRLSSAPVEIERSLDWRGREQPSDSPLLLVEDDEALVGRIRRSADDFRRVFPISLNYPGIIVRDTVVTLERFHRDDHLLSELMLDEQERQQLDQLWKELHYISRDALQVRNSLATLIQGESIAYEQVADEIHRRADETEQNLLTSESSHMESLYDFIDRAYRRPLLATERQAILELYQSLRDDGLPHEEAFRAALARGLVSPNFLFRIEQPALGTTAAPVSDWELAARLSYFLWSSMPDEELQQTVASGRLRDPQVLARQVRRMLQDGKSRALAIEFGTQWLEVRSFDQFQGKNQELFPTFDIHLRQAMYEESILFFQDLFQSDRPIWQLIDADHTFLNETLAKHYDIPGIQGDEFRRVDGVQLHGRGGMLGWASVLAKHSGASRTSPVLRGNWIAETVLGERLPRPPPVVPKLPEDETAGTLTIRQLVEMHAELKQCAVCHQRIDPLGFALEQYDTVGRRRYTDLAGRPVDADAQLKDGTTFEGIGGLRKYLLTQRRDDFVRQFCRKLLGYALGRRVILSDRQQLEAMEAALEKNDGRLSAVILSIVGSKQFQYIRGSALAE